MAFTTDPESGTILAESVVGADAFVLQAAKTAQAATVRNFFMLSYFKLEIDLQGDQREELAIGRDIKYILIYNKFSMRPIIALEFPQTFGERTGRLPILNVQGCRRQTLNFVEDDRFVVVG
jgi:hypothetical protein